jgi:hypothetical protein
MLSALALLPPGLWLLIVAQIAQSMPILLAAAALSGVSGGLGYRGSLEVVNRISPSDRRSEVVSSYLVAVYAGNSVPVIGIGLLSAITASLVAHEVFAVVIMVLAVAAFAAGVKYSPQQDS